VSSVARGFPRPNDVFLGNIATTTSAQGWVDVSFEFVAPSGASDRLLLLFESSTTVAQPGSYPGIDLVKLVRACSGAGVQSCQRQDPPTIDDGLACTQDSCSPSTGVQHVQLAAGTACNGTGVCMAGGDCTNHPPVITSAPQPYHLMNSGPYVYQATATDPDNDPVTFTKLPGSTGAWTISSSGLLTFSPGQSRLI
jgi:hypothetical protein